MTAWRSATLADDDYVRGQLPLPGWPDGGASLRLPTTETIPIVVHDGRGVGASLFVWNYLGPSQPIETLAPHNGSPGLVRVVIQPSTTTGRRIALDAAVASDEVELRHEIWGLAEQALDWMGAGTSFEAIWAYVAHRGLDLGPVDLALILWERFVVDDLGRVWEDRQADDGVANWNAASLWDSIEIAYWDLSRETAAPFLERTYRKARPSSLDGLEYHLDEIRHLLLSAAEEQRLGTIIHRGQDAEDELRADPEDLERRRELGWAVRRADEAREEFATRNLRLVFDIAKRYRRQIEDTTLELGDLVQAGYLGLLRAVEKFDATRGFKFSTYATWWIRQAITRWIADRSRTIRLPVHLHDQIVRMERARTSLRQSLGREPLRGELSADLGMAEDKLEELERHALMPLSLEQLMDAPLSRAVLEELEDPLADDPETIASRTMLRGYLELAMSSLTDRERTVIDLRFGLIDGQIHTLEEIGQQFNVTRERIRQLETKALEKMRRPSRTRHLMGWIPHPPKPAPTELDDEDADTAGPSEAADD